MRSVTITEDGTVLVVNEDGSVVAKSLQEAERELQRRREAKRRAA